MGDIFQFVIIFRIWIISAIKVYILLKLFVLTIVVPIISPFHLYPPKFYVPKIILFQNYNHNDHLTVTNIYSQHVVNEEKVQQQQEPQGKTGLYIHIPYCRKRCNYCNFAIVPVGTSISTTPINITLNINNHNNITKNKQQQGFDRMNDLYVTTLLSELSLIYKQHHQRNIATTPMYDHNITTTDVPITTTITKVPIHSIYFGGGTPSLLPIHSMQQIIEAITQHPDSIFDMDIRNCEITIEIDPGTFTIEQLYQWKALGINRLSLGIQSFDDTILESSLGRCHTIKDIYHSISMIRTVYGDDVNYSIDLLSGIPGLSIAKWIETLYIVTNCLYPPPKHLSIYDLQIEQGTVFGRIYGNVSTDESIPTFRTTINEATSITVTSNATFRLPSARESAFMYQFTSGYLRSKNYDHYEISSYALRTDTQPMSNTTTSTSRYRSQHNQLYWGYNSAWYAIGLGSTSFILNTIVQRPKSLMGYVDWVQQENILHDKSHTNQKSNTPDVSNDTNIDHLMDIILKRLRTSDGLSTSYVQQHYGIQYVQAIEYALHPYFNLNMVYVQFVNDDRILCLRDPAGFLYSNTIISNIFYEIEQISSSSSNNRLVEKLSYIVFDGTKFSNS